MEINQKQLKILFWRTEFYGPVTEGGTASLHIGKIIGLNKLGHKCIYTSSGPMVLPEYVKYYYIPYSKFFRNFPEVLNLPYNRKSIKEINRIIALEQPDFIYQHHHDFHWGGATIKKDLGLPFLLHVDGLEYWVKKNWGKLYLDHFLKWAEEIQLECADAIVTPSQQLKDLLVKFNVKAEKIFPAPNGVDTDFYTPDVNGSEIRNKLGLKDKFVICFTGTFGKWHGIEVLAETVKHIVRQIPNAVVLYVGDGDLRPNIENIHKRDNVENHTILTGFVPWLEISKYLAASDILVSPCVSNTDIDFFNSPVKLFEYLGMGKPIVASEVGQQGEVIKHEHNGLLVPEKSPEALAEAIVRLYKDPELALQLGRQARIDAVEKHDWKVNAETIVKAYNYAKSKKQ